MQQYMMSLAQAQQQAHYQQAQAQQLAQLQLAQQQQQHQMFPIESFITPPTEHPNYSAGTNPTHQLMPRANAFSTQQHLNRR